jgi:pilus assembly protein CpaB
MDRKKIILILGAAWLSAALLTWFLYAATKAPHIEKTTAVVAAARDLPAGALLRKEDLTTIAVRDKEIPGHAILDSKLAINHALLLPVSANEPITSPKLGATGIEGLPAVIDIGMRAVTVPITDATGVGGLIPPRAHVDVLFTRSGSTREALTSTILEDVVVLAMGRVTEVTPTDTSKAAASSTAANPARAQTATLLVTPDQVRRIELAKNLGKISLSLRNPLDDTDTGEETTTTPEDLGMVVPPPPVRTVIQRPIEPPRLIPPPVVVSKAPPPKPKTVEVFRGSTHVQEAIK